MSFRDNVSQTALYLIEWMSLLFKHGWKTQGAVIKSNISQIVEAQAIFFTAVVLRGKHRKTEKAFGLVCFCLLRCLIFISKSIIDVLWLVVM